MVSGGVWTQLALGLYTEGIRCSMKRWEVFHPQGMFELENVLNVAEKAGLHIWPQLIFQQEDGSFIVVASREVVDSSRKPYMGYVGKERDK